MHIVKLNGGLGNQMFQYAFALALERRYGGVKLDLEWIRAEMAHNGYELDRHFRVSLPVCGADERAALGDVDPSFFGRARRKLGLNRKSHYISPWVSWDPEYLSVDGDRYFSGYWQSPRYYEEIEDLIRGAFEFVEPLSERNRAFLDKAAGRTLIGIHVRRGDSLRNPDFLGVCEVGYYSAAMRQASEGARSPLFAFFSDDLDWCRDKLPAEGERIFVDWNRKEESYADMRLMIACDALVIANSSFSWWGAWLGAGPGRRVFAPTPWFLRHRRDNPYIVPQEWIRVPGG